MPPLSYYRFLAFMLAMLLPSTMVTAENRSTPVVEVYTFNVSGDLPGFTSLIKKARAVGKKINADASTSLSVYSALEAGPLSDQVTVAVEHESLTDWSKAAELISADPEWQAIARQFNESDYKLLSRSLHVQVISDR